MAMGSMARCTILLVVLGVACSEERPAPKNPAVPPPPPLATVVVATPSAAASAPIAQKDPNKLEGRPTSAAFLRDGTLVIASDFELLTIDHGGGVSSTYSWLTSIAVKKGNVVARGDVVARSGSGHPGDEEPSLHLGVKLNGAYVDPLDYLGPIDISEFIRLAPLGSQSAAMAVGTPTPWSGGHPSWFP